MKTLVLTLSLLAVAAFVAAGPPPPQSSPEVLRHSEVSPIVSASNVTERTIRRAPQRGRKERADDPRAPFSTEESASIFRIAHEYRPEGLSIPTYMLQRGPLPDTAVVRISIRRGDRDEIVCVLTLKKEGKEWKVESCAR